MLKASTSSDEVVVVVVVVAFAVCAAEEEVGVVGVVRWVRPSQVGVEAARCRLNRSASCFPLMTNSPMNSPWPTEDSEGRGWESDRGGRG